MELFSILFSVRRYSVCVAWECFLKLDFVSNPWAYVAVAVQECRRDFSVQIKILFALRSEKDVNASRIVCGDI